MLKLDLGDPWDRWERDLEAWDMVEGGYSILNLILKRILKNPMIAPNVKGRAEGLALLWKSMPLQAKLRSNCKASHQFLSTLVQIENCVGVQCKLEPLTPDQGRALDPFDTLVES